MKYVAAYVAAAVMFGITDAVWLTTMTPLLYQPALGPILAEQPNIAPAVVFYLLYIAGIVILAVAPALKDGGWKRAALMGAVFGLIAYATYDLTNQATLKIWATKVTVLDMTYGALATSLAAVVAFLAARRVAK